MWNEAYPIGNGALGAMCSGDARSVRIQINDETGWSGSPLSESIEPVVDADAARAALATARRAVEDGRYRDAGDAVRLLQHRHSQAFLPFAHLVLEVSAAESAATLTGRRHAQFERVLDLATATHSIAGAVDGVSITHETWASRPHGVLVHEVAAAADVDILITLNSAVRVLSRTTVGPRFEIQLRLPSDVAPPHEHAEEPIRYTDGVGEALEGAAVAEIDTDGEVVESDDRISIRGARRVVIWLATATTFTGMGRMPHGDASTAASAARTRLARARRDGLELVRRAQLEDHHSLYARTELAIDQPSTSDTRTTDERLLAINGSEDADLSKDPSLAALLFHFGRYLLICSSRLGGVPANLQGVWNDSLQPAWSSNFTTNINVQMNYWPAFTANLAETADPLLALIEALADRGQETAARLYGADGWVAHHNTDVWAYTQPVGNGADDPKWAFWPLAGIWLCRHIVDQLEFGQLDDRRARSGFDAMRGGAEFALTWMSVGEDGIAFTSPSTSPENEFRAPDGSVAAVASSSALDLELVADHFRSLARLAEHLGIRDDEVVSAGLAMLARIPKPTVGSTGAIAEWADDFDQVDPHHRHLSPLLYVYPGTGTLSAAEHAAASSFLDERGDESTGWSLAWKLALRARLRQPDAIDRLLRLVFRDMTVDRGEWVGGLYSNLLAAHPPFQIDGNFGYVAAVAEFLVQSHNGIITLLPAVPQAFAAGRVRGLVARPGIEVELAWSASAEGPHLVRASLSAQVPSALGTHRVLTPQGEITVTLEEIDLPIALELSSPSE